MTEGLPGRMLLRSTLTSPYGRKVRMAIEVLGLRERVEVSPADPRDPGDSLRVQNPLGKIPCLVLPSGESLFDSRVIVEALDDLSGARRLIPRAGPERYRALTRAALADGITDAALLMVYEHRWHPGGPVSGDWLAHLAGKIGRGLAAFAADPPDPARTDAVSIGLAAALGYLDWRRPVDWRAMEPGLARWLDAFAAAEPAFDATRAPEG